MSGALARTAIWTGGLALVAVTAINVAAVIGRRVGLPVHGAIELVQVGVLVAGVLALLRATALGAHARVHLLLDRMAPPRRAVVERLCSLAGALFFAGLLAGSLWIQSDLWTSGEASEVIGVPWRALRLIANLALAGVTLLFLRDAVRGRQ